MPDITVITPIFNDGKIVFFVASRGHHADVGGIAPGSMPPLSKTLVQVLSIKRILSMFYSFTFFILGGSCYYCIQAR